MTSLSEIAEQAMIDQGFIPEFTSAVIQEVSSIDRPASPLSSPLFRDLRSWAWVSIDNDDSRDLDQLTYAESDKIYVAIADVDAIVKRDSPIDRQASHNTTSVYTPGRIFPMLPLKLSTNLTSLNENTDRCAIVAELHISSEGEFRLTHVYPAWVHNHKKLTYNTVGAALDEGVFPSEIVSFKEQLLLQDAIATSIQNYRDRQGALHFAEMELQPLMRNGEPMAIEEKKINRAHKLIENFMIAANVGVAHFLEQHKKPIVRRIVRTPKRWDRIVALAHSLGETLPPHPDAKALRGFLLRQQQAAPDRFADLSLAVIKLIGPGEYVTTFPGENPLGHFDLAEANYAHTTAPNRRYPDLVIQRLLKSCFYGGSPYTKGELESIATHCTLKEKDATKVERRLFKCAAAMAMRKEIGRVFPAMVTGASEKGTWVRLAAPPIEGKLVRGYQGLDVGDYAQVKLIRVDTFHGYIDFERV